MAAGWKACDTADKNVCATSRDLAPNPGWRADKGLEMQTEVANPSQLMVLGDGFEGGKGIIVDGLMLLRRRDGVQDYLGSTARARARHKEKANVVFCDGHVEAPSLKYLFEDSADSALARWNRDNLPHRDLLTP